MKQNIYADLHIHSAYSRACSKDITISNLEKYAKIKGLNLLGTGDFTHPKWVSHIKENLVEDSTGILKTKTGFNFMLQTEISLIYKQDDKGRRIHNIVFAPNLDTVKQITDYLLKKGRVDYDGRPIFKIPSHEFVYELKKINKDIEIVPAHIWTPHFSLFGAYNQFSRVEDCFQDQTKHIFALETGLSSDPEMNWRVSQLDRFSLISNSDSHSFWPWRIGREFNHFNTEMTYKKIMDAIRTREGFVKTVEIDPAFGKYHASGHRNCNVVLTPSDAIKMKGICPACKKPLTVGVENRVEELADRPLGFKPKGAVPFKKMLPLSDLMAFSSGKKTESKIVQEDYYKLVQKFENEINILENVSELELNKAVDAKLKHLILKNRIGEIKVKPGYDGVYGEILE